MKKMKRLVILSLCMIFFAAFVSAQTPQTIQAGFTVERELGAETHIYEISLTKGQMLDFTVEQRGIDVVLRVATGDGKFVDRVDSPNERTGDEPFTIVSLTGGRYRIEVSRLWEDAAQTAGKYFVKTVAIRAATSAEIKTARLKEELLKIVMEENRFGSYPDVLKRYFAERALVTNSFGYTSDVSELMEATTRNPPKLPAGASSKDELSMARVENFGDVVVLSVNRDRRFKNPQANIDQRLSQRAGYIFKRVKGEWRIINIQRSFAARERQPVKLDAAQLDALTGVYDGGANPSETLTVTRDGGELFANFPEQERFRLFADTENTFIGGFMGIAFVRDASGAVRQAVVYHSMPDDRMTIQPKVK